MPSVSARATLGFGERLRDLRKTRHLTQSQLDCAAGFSRGTTYRLETGAAASVEHAARLSAALKVSLAWLVLGRSNDADAASRQVMYDSIISRLDRLADLIQSRL